MMMTKHPFDIYSGIDVEPELGINVSTGHYPFIENQKFLRGQMKFKVVEFIYCRSRWALFGQNVVTDVIFETIKEPKERFKVGIFQVLESIKAGRTKFSL